jgi:AbrB family looped-hinge helix DNA binding protein
MEIGVIGSKYQVVIPRGIRKKLKTIQPGTKVVFDTDGEKVSLNPQAKSWVEENYGILAEDWKGIDMIKEVKKMRDEWDQRLDEQKKLWNYGKNKK